MEPAVSSLRQEDLPLPITSAPQNETLGIEGGSFVWHGHRPVAASNRASGSLFKLDDITVSFNDVGLSVISGPTGCGKSSLLAALLGEMTRLSGVIHLPKRPRHRGESSLVSYAAQTPWLEAGKSIKANILFVTPFDADRYRETLAACALEHDLALMDDGDDTRISQHTLSGGQKARIALARALYARSQHVLLDDPLAAVDSHTAQHLFKKALTGRIAQDRTIILVTHHVGLVLPRTRYLVSMHAGRIDAQGTPPELRARGLLSDVIEEARTELEAETRQDRTQVQDGEQRLQEQPHAESQGPTEPDTTAKAPEKRTGQARLLYELETRPEGTVRFAFFKTYISASSLILWILVFACLVAFRLASTGEQLLLKIWGEAYQSKDKASAALSHLPSFPPTVGNQSFYLSIYGFIGLTIVLLNSIKVFFLFWASIVGSRSIFASLLAAVVRAPLRWFDITPSGRILNRFTSDIGVVDGDLPAHLSFILNNGLALLSYFIICAMIGAYLLFPHPGRWED